MAEYDRRGVYQNNRKRRFRDDDSDPRAFQRRRPDIPIPIRIRRQLLALADLPLRDWHEDILAAARLVADNTGADDDEGDRDRDSAYVRDQFVAFVAKGPLVLEHPLKIPFVAAVLQVLNTLKPAVVLDVLRAVAATTETAIAQGRWRDAKLRLRLLACLQPCLKCGGNDGNGDGVFSLLDTLFARAVDLQTASSDDVVGTELVKIILLTIPYIMASTTSPVSTPTYARWQQRAADLMEKTEVIASEPHALQSLLDPYLHDSVPDADEGAEDGDAPPPAESLIALLQKQLQAEAAGGWPLSCLPRPWKLPLEELELQAKLDDQPTKHVLPMIAVPDIVVAGPRSLFPELYFSVYGAWANAADATEATPAVVHSVPPLTHVASSLVRDVLIDTVNGLDFNRNVTARYLIDVDCYFAEHTFVKRATPFDRLRDVDAGQSTWKPEDVAVDTVFAQLFQLPVSEHKLVYYHAVLAEACKLAPSAIAPSLGRAIRFLYRNSPRMDLELVGRFVDWFAHHVSNFGFTWKWDEWVDDVALSDLHPHKAFILGAIEKEIRLSFAQRIKNTLPAQYQALIRRETELDVPPFKYQEAKTGPDGEDGGGVPFAAEGRELAVLLKRKASDDDIQAVIERIHSQVLDENVVPGDEGQLQNRRRVDPLVASTDAFTTAVLWVGAKSLSHVLAYVERTKERFFDASAASEAACTQILASVMTFWSAHPGVAVSIVEKLLNYEILTPAAVVQWALQQPHEEMGGAGEENFGGDSYGKALATTHVSELVFHTVNKVTRRVHQLVAASQTADAAVATARKGLRDAQEQQRNPPAVPTANQEQQQADDLDVAMDEGSANEAAAAAVAQATAVVEAAESELAQAEAAAETAHAAEAKEAITMHELFEQLRVALEPWLAAGSVAVKDRDQESGRLIQAWAVRWQRVVQRCAAMEEAFLGEVTRGRGVSDVNENSNGVAASGSP